MPDFPRLNFLGLNFVRLKPASPLSQGLQLATLKIATLTVATSMVLASALSLQGQAQIGPQAPEPKAPAENSVGKALKKLLQTQKVDPKQAGTTTKIDRNVTPDDNYLPGGKRPTVQVPMQRPVQAAPTESAIKHPPLLVQPPLSSVKIDQTEVDSENPPAVGHPKLDDPTNPLGFADAEVKLKRLSMLVDQKRFPEAKLGLMQLRQTLVDLTEAHIGLYKTLNQLPSARGQAELEKE